LTVYYAPWNTSKNMLEETDRLYDESGMLECVAKGDLVAIKLHVGELGNPYHIQPMFAHKLAQKIKEAGGKPFFTDSNTLYHAQRGDAYDHMETALINGFSKEHFIVADGLRGENYKTVKTKGILNTIEVSGAIVEADAMIVLTHVKGHELTGFGGAIKNIGMGCTPGLGKLRQHRAVDIEIDQSKCIGCGKCKVTCNMHLPDIIEGKARITSSRCMRCPMCIEGCPKHAIRFNHKENFSKAIASAAYGVLSTFKKGKVSYVSFAKDITQYCDCLPNPGKIAMKDIGVLASDSPVSIDAAFLSMANFRIFNEAYDVDCMLQVQEAKALGIGGDVAPKITKI
jgi:uncharacterized Fe-S center protein